MDFYIFVGKGGPEWGNRIEGEVFEVAESWFEGEDFVFIAETVQMIWISISVQGIKKIRDQRIQKSSRNKKDKRSKNLKKFKE